VSIDLTGALRVIDGSLISTSTASAQGTAGSINIHATAITIDGGNSAVRAEAVAGSSGQTGSISVTALREVLLSNRRRVVAFRTPPPRSTQLSIQPTSVSVAAPHIDLIGGRISAASGGNVAASNISVHATEGLTARNASITTTAQDGNGGGIDLLGGHSCYWITRR
jgi:hypothetical protein